MDKEEIFRRLFQVGKTCGEKLRKAEAVKTTRMEKEAIRNLARQAAEREMSNILADIERAAHEYTGDCGFKVEVHIQFPALNEMDETFYRLGFLRTVRAMLPPGSGLYVETCERPKSGEGFIIYWRP
jgi:hypothetical protein